MKKDEKDLKEVIKQAILEAFAEMYGVATVEGEGDTDDSAPEDGENSGNGNNNSGNNGSNNGSGNNGSGSGPIEPQPIIGVGGLSVDTPEDKE